MVFVFICKKEGSTWKAHCTTDEGVEAEASTFSGLEDELKDVRCLAVCPPVCSSPPTPPSPLTAPTSPYHTRPSARRPTLTAPWPSTRRW